MIYSEVDEKEIEKLQLTVEEDYDQLNGIINEIIC